MKTITKKLLTLVLSLSLALSALPAIGFADTAVTETIPVGDNSAWIIDPLNGDVGMKFGLSSANMVRSDSYIYFDLKDISQIEKLELSLTSSGAATYKITKYRVADEIPAETDIALYDEDTDEYKQWTAFDTAMTALASEEQIQIITTADNLTASADITSLINGCQKENGYLVLRIKNGANRSLIFSSSSLNVTYKADYTAPDYLSDVNSAMTATDMEAAVTNAAADYFGVDKDALYDMSGVYEALVSMLENDDFTKESFKAAFDAEVEKYIETKEITIDNIAYFGRDQSTATGLTDLNFRTNSAEVFPTQTNTNVPFIGAKLDNTAAIKEIELYTYASSTDTARQFAVRGAYLLDEFKTGNASVYSAPAEGETSEVYSFWKELGDDFINSSMKYNSSYFNIGRGASSIMTVSNADDVRIRTVDLTDYVKTGLNKYGEDKYLVLHINASANVSLYIAASGDNKRIPKLIVKYDTTVSSSAKTAAWDALEEAMSADDIKAIVENFGTALGIDNILKLTDGAGLYEELLLSIDDFNDIEAFISKANELYNKYTAVRTVMPSEELMYNSSAQSLSKADNGFAPGKRYITQYLTEALGNGENVLGAEYRIYTAESNTFANSTFVRTIPAIAFDGFDPTETYYIGSAHENYNEAAAAAISDDILGTQWVYMGKTKPVSRINLAAGANAYAVDITDSLKEKLNMNLNKVAYTIGVEQQDGNAQLDNTTGSAAALSVTYDRTYNAAAAMAAFKAAETADDYKAALSTYSVEFNVTDEYLTKLDDYSDDAIIEGLAPLKESCTTIFEVEEALKNVNFKTSVIKFEIQSFTEADGSLKANVKKLSAYDGEVKALFVAYKSGTMTGLVPAANAEALLTAEKESVTELTASGSLGEYDTVKVMIINSYAQLTPLAVVYSPIAQ